MIKFDDIKNSTVLVRVAFDLPDLSHTSRIDDAVDTLVTLLTQKNKVLIVSKWGRPKDSDPSLSMKLMVDTIEFRLKEIGNLDKKVEFVNQFESFNTTKLVIESSTSELFLLENCHFEPLEKSKEEEERLGVAKKYASLADYFVDEAFPSSHRNEATNTDIKSLLPWTYGLAFTKEIKNLEKLKSNFESPFLVVMAGAKLKTKLPIISQMIKKADKILVGGLLSFAFIKAMQELGLSDKPELYDSPVEEDFLETAKKLIVKYPGKLVLPTDLVYEEEDGKTYARDVGEKTVDLFKKNLKDAKTLFWNGTLGFYEKPPFDKGTLEVGRFCAGLDGCFKVLGGGDTGSSLPDDVLNKFDFVSMGGGATLEYLSNS